MNPFLPPDPPPLPDPPFLAHYVLESPWALAVFILLLGLLTWKFLAPRLPPARGRFLTGFFVVCAVFVVFAAHFVETPREQVSKAAKQLVADVAAADTLRVRAALAPDAALYWWLNPDGLPLDGILDRIDRDFSGNGQYRVKEHAILEVQAQSDDPTRARVQMKVRVTSQAQGVPLISWWRLDYALGPAGSWQVTGIQPLAVPTISNPTGR